MEHSNPLTRFMRQPKIYITLPSNGRYWPSGSIDLSNNSVPVYSMTARDELTLKTPDALLNGQAVVDVIQSCIPSIKDAWYTPIMDLDLILLSIRLASYGEWMDVSFKVPVCNEDVDRQIDIRTLIDSLNATVAWEELVEISNDLRCFVQPLSYKELTASSLRTFEAQRILQSASQDGVTEEQKREIYNSSINALSNLTIDTITSCISAIEVPGAVVKDKKFIKEFLDNSDKGVCSQIQEHISKYRSLCSIQPIRAFATPEQIANGAPESFLVPVTMDNSDFFAQGS